MTSKHSEGSERARDLIDLQLLAKGEDLDPGRVRATCVRLFEYRRQQAWPPTVEAGDRWHTLCATAVDWVRSHARIERSKAPGFHRA